MPSLVTMLTHSDGYLIAPQPPQQQVYFYDYEEIQITSFNKALVDFGRPSSPMIGNPADNSIPFKEVPESIIDQINQAKAVPPTPIVYRENSPGGTDRARPPPGLPLRPPPGPPLPHPMIEEIRTIGHMTYDTTRKESIFTPCPDHNRTQPRWRMTYDNSSAESTFTPQPVPTVPADDDDNSSNTETAQIGDNSITSFHGFPEQKLDSTSYLDSMDCDNSITHLKDIQVDAPDQLASIVTAQAMNTLFGDSPHLTDTESYIADDIVLEAIDAIMDSFPHVRNDDAIALIKTMAFSACLDRIKSLHAEATSTTTSVVVTVEDHYWQAMLLTTVACAIAATLTSTTGRRRLHCLLYSMAAWFWGLVGQLLSVIATCPEDTPIPMEVENLCKICLQFYTGPHPFCAYCGMIEAGHHGGCCLEKPAYIRRRRTQPQPIWGRFPDFH